MPHASIPVPSRACGATPLPRVRGSSEPVMRRPRAPHRPRHPHAARTARPETPPPRSRDRPPHDGGCRGRRVESGAASVSSASTSCICARGRACSKGERTTRWFERRRSNACTTPGRGTASSRHTVSLRIASTTASSKRLVGGASAGSGPSSWRTPTRCSTRSGRQRASWQEQGRCSWDSRSCKTASGCVALSRHMAARRAPPPAACTGGATSARGSYTGQ